MSCPIPGIAVEYEYPLLPVYSEFHTQTHTQSRQPRDYMALPQLTPAKKCKGWFTLYGGDAAHIVLP